MAKDGSELLDELMRFKPDGLTPNAWAVRAGVGRTIWADLRRHGNPSRRTLSKLLEAAGSSLAEFEALRVGAAPPVAPAAKLAEQNRSWGQARALPLPLLSTELGGLWGGDAEIDLLILDRRDVVALLAGPPSLAVDPGAYAIPVVSKSMWPRFRKGRRLAVSPAAAIGPGDDVIVILAAGGGALIGELQSQNRDFVVLRQYDPAREFAVAATEIDAVHKVLGELI